MASINRISAGQTLWDRKRATGLKRYHTEWEEWPVYVEKIEIGTAGSRVLISWNGNPSRWITADELKKYRVKKRG